MPLVPYFILYLVLVCFLIQNTQDWVIYKEIEASFGSWLWRLESLRSGSCIGSASAKGLMLLLRLVEKWKSKKEKGAKL